MFQIAIAEDDADALKTILSYLEKYKKEKSLNFEIRTFSNGEQLLFDYRPEYDLVLLDIEMPQMDGMTAAGKIRRMDSEVSIIFITNMAQYAIEGYKVQARAYLLKPLSYTALHLELDAVFDGAGKKIQNSIVVSNGDSKNRIKSQNILYVEVRRHDVNIHTADGIFRMRGSMKQLEEQVKDLYFVRSDVSYLVNLKYVDSIEKETVRIGSENIPLSRRRRAEFIDAFSSYIGE